MYLWGTEKNELIPARYGLMEKPEVVLQEVLQRKIFFSSKEVLQRKVLLK